MTEKRAQVNIRLTPTNYKNYNNLLQQQLTTLQNSEQAWFNQVTTKYKQTLTAYKQENQKLEQKWNKLSAQYPELLND